MADNDDEKKLSGAEEYMAAEVELSEPLAPEQEKQLRDAMDKMEPGAIDSCDIGPKKISLCYDPTRTKKEALLDLIKQAGGKIEHVENEGSPLR
ncbi:MAG: hypothetical protein ACR2G0_07510 [Chthoniobacterales bacterium]